jgi:insulysin
MMFLLANIILLSFSVDSLHRAGFGVQKWLTRHPLSRLSLCGGSQVNSGPRHPKNVAERKLNFGFLSSLTAAGITSFYASRACAVGSYSSESAGVAKLKRASEMASGVVKKGAIDDRVYRAFTLENGLRVLVVSDKETSRAAAALNVHVGSFCDPLSVPGLAHFAEHMCFLGTKKYPYEGDFQKFLSSHGGSSNAFTDSEDTQYYFDCTEPFLSASLDRFSHFFIDPLFTPSAVGRELNAIDSEHSKNLNNDGFRLYQLDKSGANPLHPLHKFATGNKETLEKVPKQKGINIRDELIAYHQKYYTAERMTLCIVGKAPPSELEAQARKYFGAVPRGTEPDPALQWWNKIEPYYEQIAASELEVVPIGQQRRLALSWPIHIPSPESRRRLLATKSESIVAHLIGHEGVGSIRSILVDRGWGNAVQASISNDISDVQLFEITIDLTEKGMRNRYEVIDLVFSYIALLADAPVPHYILQEVSQLASIGFNFAEKADPQATASAAAADMQDYAPELYVAGPHLFTPDVDEIKSYISELTPARCRIKSVGQEFAGKTSQTERWYGTHYSNTSLPELTARWKRVSSKAFPVALPAPNKLIPENFRLVAAPVTGKAARAGALAEPPALLRNDSKWLVYHKTDRVFAQPKVFAVFLLALPSSKYDPDFAIQSDLFSNCLLDSLNEYLYDARLAGLGIDFRVTPRGLQLEVTGFSDKLSDFTRDILQKIRAFEPDQASFDRFKDLFSRSLAAWKTQQPYYHASYYAGLVTETLTYPIDDMKAALIRTKMDAIKRFIPQSLSSSHGTAMITGNIKAEEALALVEALDADFQFNELRPELRSRKRSLLLPNGHGIRLSNKEPNENDDNSASTWYFQMPSRDLRDKVIIEMMADTIDELFYDSLRTKQQLGYIVQAGARDKNGIYYLTLVAQSNAVNGPELTKRINQFVLDLPAYYDSFSPDDFESFRAGIISRKLEPDQRLSSQAERFWSEILKYPVEKPNFSRLVEEVRVLEKISLSDFVAFAKDVVSLEGSKRHLLVSEVGAAVNSQLPQLPFFSLRDMPSIDQPL